MPPEPAQQAANSTARPRLFHADLYDAIGSSAEEVVIVDCAGVTFVGSAGYQALVEATEYAIRQSSVESIRNLSARCAEVSRFYGRGPPTSYRRLTETQAGTAGGEPGKDVPTRTMRATTDEHCGDTTPGEEGRR
jgi:hypothetical protein